MQVCLLPLLRLLLRKLAGSCLLLRAGNRHMMPA
jgi:hypothetical protein